MRRRGSGLTRAFCASTTVLFSGFLALACSAGSDAPTGDATGTTSQAVTADQPLFHSHVNRHSWQKHVGHNGFCGDEERSCHPAPVPLCSVFDADVGIQTDAKACDRETTPDCPDRVDTWDAEIVIDFAVAITSDCRFGQWAPPLLTDTDVSDYLNDLLSFTLQFFGCPEQGTTGKLAFGLIPAPLQGDRFTTADLDVLADTYSAAVAQALSDFGAPPLTARQAQDIDRSIHALAHRVHGAVPSRNFTFSTCAPGAAPPADTRSDDDCR